LPKTTPPALVPPPAPPPPPPVPTLPAAPAPVPVANNMPPMATYRSQLEQGAFFADTVRYYQTHPGEVPEGVPASGSALPDARIVALIVRAEAWNQANPSLPPRSTTYAVRIDTGPSPNRCTADWIGIDCGFVAVTSIPTVPFPAGPGGSVGSSAGGLDLGAGRRAPNQSVGASAFRAPPLYGGSSFFELNAPFSSYDPQIGLGSLPVRTVNVYLGQGRSVTLPWYHPLALEAQGLEIAPSGEE
jgi:hypothetical protein